MNKSPIPRRSKPKSLPSEISKETLSLSATPLVPLETSLSRSRIVRMRQCGQSVTSLRDGKQVQAKTKEIWYRCASCGTDFHGPKEYRFCRECDRVRKGRDPNRSTMWIWSSERWWKI